MCSRSILYIERDGTGSVPVAGSKLGQGIDQEFGLICVNLKQMYASNLQRYSQTLCECISNTDKQDNGIYRTSDSSTALIILEFFSTAGRVYVWYDRARGKQQLRLSEHVIFEFECICLHVFSSVAVSE